MALVATGGVVASQAASTPAFYACVKSGVMSSVGTKKPSCAKGSTLISWGAQGPAGAPGRPGASSGLEIVSEDGKTTVKVVDFANHLVMLPDGAILKLGARFDDGVYSGSFRSARTVVTQNMTAHYLKPGCSGQPLYVDAAIFEDPSMFADPDSNTEWWDAWENHAQKDVFDIYDHMAPPGQPGGMYTIGKKFPASSVKSTAVWDAGDDVFYCDEADIPGKIDLMGLDTYTPPQMGIWRFK
jgi:hypothetical protein